MKKIVFFVFVLSFSFISCKKEEKQCWDCVATGKATSGGSTYTATQTTSICDKTETEIREIEKSGQITIPGSGSATTKCYIKGTAPEPETPTGERVLK
jgi:hypothetical protein